MSCPYIYIGVHAGQALKAAWFDSALGEWPSTNCHDNTADRLWNCFLLGAAYSTAVWMNHSQPRTFMWNNVHQTDNCHWWESIFECKSRNAGTNLIHATCCSNMRCDRGQFLYRDNMCSTLSLGRVLHHMHMTKIIMCWWYLKQHNVTPTKD